MLATYKHRYTVWLSMSHSRKSDRKLLFHDPMAELGKKLAGICSNCLALTCVRLLNYCDFMVALIITALSCVIHIPRHLATSHHHYTISKGSLALAAKVKWALYEHRSLLHICLRSYIAAGCSFIAVTQP